MFQSLQHASFVSMYLKVKTSLKKAGVDFPADFHWRFFFGMTMTHHKWLWLEITNGNEFCELGAGFWDECPIFCHWLKKNITVRCLVMWKYRGQIHLAKCGWRVFPCADLSGTCGTSWRTFLGCCCHHILAERYSQGKGNWRKFMQEAEGLTD